MARPTQPMHTKEQLNVRISDEAHAILRGLQDHLGLTRIGVVELAIRELARKNHLSIPELVRQYPPEPGSKRKG